MGPPWGFWYFFYGVFNLPVFEFFLTHCCRLSCNELHSAIIGGILLYSHIHTIHTIHLHTFSIEYNVKEILLIKNTPLNALGSCWPTLKSLLMIKVFISGVRPPPTPLITKTIKVFEFLYYKSMAHTNTYKN